jgi:hypothetical protein
MAAEQEERPTGAPEDQDATASREDDASERAAEIEQDPAQNPPEDDLKRIKGG